MSRTPITPRSHRLRRSTLISALAVAFLATSASVSWAASPSLAAAPAQTTVTRVHPATGVARWVSIGQADRAGFARATPELAARAVLRSHSDLFGLRNPDEELNLQRFDRDNLDRLHFVYAQSYQGVPVFGGDLRIHMDEGGQPQSMSGVIIPHLELDATPSISADAAGVTALAAIAKNHQAAAQTLEAEQLGLVVFREGLLRGVNGSNYLAYKIEVGNGSSIREHVFVDAHAGVVIEHYTLVHEALFRRLYETDLGNEIWTEGDALPGALDIWQQNELAAASHTYQFFDNAFGWASYDDADAEMLTINNDPGIDCPNATWNGSNAGYCTGTASDDVVAHEWGHAYTQFTNGLIYAWQSGGLNESYSDIWGETIDLLNGYEDAGENLSLRASCGSSDRWRMGEDASAFGGAIRDMWDPTCNGDPGKVSDGQYVCSSGDSGGVHSNSGVPNHVYALLVDGGSYNGETISALGFTKAAHIHWRAQAFYETVTTDFFAHADALEQACDDLIGINLEGLSTGAAAGPSGEIITLADCQEVADVALATELREEACPGQFEPLLDPDAPSLCSTGVPTEVELYDFESGLGSWTVGQLPENPGSWDSRDWTLTASLPAGRAGSGVYGPDPLFGDCQADLDNGIIYLQSPPIVIPGGTPAAVRLAFDHYVSTEPNWDGGNLKYSTDGVNFFLIPSGAFVFNAYNTTLNSAAGDGNDNPMESEPAFSGSDAGTVAGSWGQTQINLAAVGVAPGETVHFRWELGTDGCNGFDGWYVDDVHIYGCDPGPCGVEPALGCKTADPLKGLGKSSVTVKISSDASSGLLKWKWNKGAATDLGDFLDPVASGAATYHVCVFDDSANIQPLYEAAIPSLGTCRDKPCWKAAGSTKYKFKDRDASNASVSVMTLKAGTDGKSQIQVKAKGVSVSTISPPLSLNVTVQFIADDGLSPSCWQTTFSTEKSNKDRSFKAKGP